MAWIKIALKIFSGLIVIGLITLGIFFYSANRVAKHKSSMIDALAKIPVDSSVSDVMKLAEQLGFKFDSNEFAIPAVLEFTNADVPRKETDLPEKFVPGTDLSNFKNGSMNFGLSLFLFSRKGCEIVFKEGKVKSTRIWWID